MSFKTPLSLKEVWFWTLCLFVFSRIAIWAEGPDPTQLLTSLFNHNLVYWLAFTVIFVRLSRVSSSLKADKLSIATFYTSFGLLIVLGIIAIRPFDGIAAGFIGAMLLWRHQRESNMMAAAFVFFALFLNLFVGSALFTIFKSQIILIDSALAEFALRFVGFDVFRNLNSLGTSEGHTIAVIGACSAFNNISLAALAAVSGLLIVKDKLTKSDLWPILLICFAMLIFNTIRLSLFAVSRAGYEYWHEGSGAPVLAIVQTALLFAAVFILRNVSIRKRWCNGIPYLRSYRPITTCHAEIERCNWYQRI